MSEYIIDFDEKSSAYMRILVSKTAMNKGEIVRCRDCKHYQPWTKGAEPECWANGEPFKTEPDGFCAWGEPRGDAE